MLPHKSISCRTRHPTKIGLDRQISVKIRPPDPYDLTFPKEVEKPNADEDRRNPKLLGFGPLQNGVRPH